jgi:hypothetical protein
MLCAQVHEDHVATITPDLEAEPSAQKVGKQQSLGSGICRRLPAFPDRAWTRAWDLV